MVLTKNPFVKFDKLFCKRILSFCITVQTLPKKKHHFHIYCHKSETYKSSFCEVFGRVYLTNDVNVLHHLLPRQRSLSFRKKALIKGAEKEATLPSTQYRWICKVVILCYKFYFQNYQLISFNENGQAALTGCRVDGWGHYWAQ